MKHIVVHLAIFLVILCISVNFSLGGNKDVRLNYALRNSTRSRLSEQYNNNNNNNEQQNGDNNNREDDNVLKSEAQKMLRQCGVEKNDTSENSGNGFGNNDRNGYNYYGGNNNMRNNYNQFGQDQDNNGGSNSNSDNERWSTYGSRNWNRNQNDAGGSNDNYNGNSNKRQSDYNNQESNYGQSNSDSNRFGYGNFGNQNNQYGHNGNQNSRPSFGYGSSASQNGQDNFNNNDQGGSNRGFQSSSSNMYGMRSPNTGFNRGHGQEDDCGNGDNRDYNSNAFGYNTGMTFGFNRQQRQKRYNYFNRGENEGNDDNQCISQCVFGYLHMLDDDRSPSETMLIKWLQEHVTGNDMDRIKALRDARRCFGRLTTNDIEDGCEFSKELANCLELDLE